MIILVSNNLEQKEQKKLSKKTILKIVILLITILLLFVNRHNVLKTPTLTIETPQKISVSDTDEIVLDVSLSALGESLYPAASMSIAFDPSRLEFIGIEEGNVFIKSDQTENGQDLPDWSYNPEQCNNTGLINIMYLDTTGGKNAFSKELLAEDDNVVLRLNFRLRGSVREGDVCDLIFEDAIFASSNEKESLAMTTKTLRVRDGKIVIGD